MTVAAVPFALNGHAPPSGNPGVEWSHDEILTAVFPEPATLARGHINKGEIVSLSGGAGVGKSLDALDLARSVSGCQRHLGQFPTEPGSVLVIDQESSPARLQGRLQAMQLGRPIPNGSPLHFVVTTGVYIDDESGLSRIDGWLRERAPVLLVLDSFVRFHRKDENSSGDMADVGNALRRLVDRHGCAILLIDHVGKAADVAIENRLRGSGEKRALVDTAFDVQARPGEPVLRVTQTKARWSAPLAPYHVRIVSGDDGSLRLDYEEAAGKGGAARVDFGNETLAAVTHLISTKGENGADVPSLMAVLNVTDSSVGRRVDPLVRSGQLERVDVGDGPGRKRAVYRPVAGERN